MDVLDSSSLLDSCYRCCNIPGIHIRPTLAVSLSLGSRENASRSAFSDNANDFATPSEAHPWSHVTNQMNVGVE